MLGNIRRRPLGDNFNIITDYNHGLSQWDKEQGFSIRARENDLYIDGYENFTVRILNRLIERTKVGNQGQKQLNLAFIKDNELQLQDSIKKTAIENAFTTSKLMMIYGAAGTGKTTLMNYIAGVFGNGRSKLFLAGTHAAKANLELRIKNQGALDKFMTVDGFINDKTDTAYDCIFIDECSTIDNRHMLDVIKKINDTALLVLAGDIYQIESIDFGNWFYYAKNIIDRNSIVELTNTWRTENHDLISLWDEVRFKRKYMTEILSLNGEYSENISEDIFKHEYDDCVVLCLNYDGRFGLNNINNYFQENNRSPKFTWHEWCYKVGDPVLFNDNKRFRQLYNNLKGRIIKIEKDENSISFFIEVKIILTGSDVSDTDLVIVEVLDDSTIVMFTVYENDGGTTEEEREESKICSIVPFQVAYAVSIHKAQGLEYDEVKVVIPHDNCESISHGIFYTAITRARKRLTLYWSADTMQDIVNSFYQEENTGKSLQIIKSILNS